MINGGPGRMSRWPAGSFNQVPVAEGHFLYGFATPQASTGSLDPELEFHSYGKSVSCVS